MAAISSVSSVSAAQQAYQAPKSAPPPKPARSQSGEDSVHISKAALATLRGGDPDSDGA